MMQAVAAPSVRADYWSSSRPTPHGREIVAERLPLGKNRLAGPTERVAATIRRRSEGPALLDQRDDWCPRTPMVAVFAG